MAALPTLTNSLASLDKSKAKHYKKRRHSRRWWRRHRALLRRKRAAMEARKNTDAAKRMEAALPNAPALNGAMKLPVPSTWKLVNAAGNETRYEVRGGEGMSATAVWSSVQASGAPGAARAKTLGGVPVAELRRMVIDKMFAAGGWVTNDSLREVGGQRVFVVQAASGSDAKGFGASGNVSANARVAWNYYFVESNGRIYSLATATAPEFAAPLAAETEQVLASLQRNSDANHTLAAQTAR